MFAHSGMSDSNKRFELEHFEPAYLSAHCRGELDARAGIALEELADGLARRGLLVRYLVMPGQQEEASAIFRWLADKVSPDTYVNIMGQYRSEYQVSGHGVTSRPDKYSDIDRQPYRAELDAAYEVAREAGLWRFDERSHVTL